MSIAAIAFPAVDPVALRLGAFTVRWYGIAYLIGFIGAYCVMRWLVRRWGIRLSDDDLLSVVLAAIVGVILGGRLGYVAFYGEGYYWQHPGQILSTWDGGMSFHGGLIGILLAGLIAARAMGIPWLTLGDLGAVGAPIGLFFGRIANFINDELWGRATTAPWGVVFPGAGTLPRHPSQIYEALLEGVVLFVVLLWMATRSSHPPRGVIVGWFLTLYGVFRIFVEFFRQPDVQIGFLSGGFTMGQLLSVPVVAVGIAVVIWSHRRGLPEEGRSAQ
ncbi:MAG: prolipoprotein diacylglyceryl transferase [Coriobacteriia bacterium]|nr:prolipoprotein diacylglyceryl transferase [Coriobacteriia bacterium]